MQRTSCTVPGVCKLQVMCVCNYKKFISRFSKSRCYFFKVVFEIKLNQIVLTLSILRLFYGARGGSTCKFTLHPPTARINRSKIERHQPTQREKHTKTRENTRKHAKTCEKRAKNTQNRPAIKRTTRKAPDKNSENLRKTRDSCHFYKNHILSQYIHHSRQWCVHHHSC
jgi:hypothetical protein